MSMSVKLYTPQDVKQHCFPTDLWVSWSGNVYDLTSVVAENKGVSTECVSLDSPLLTPIIKFAGQDISHWFNGSTNEVPYYCK